MNQKKLGIDVSEWQGKIQWETVKPHIDFAIIRLGYGQNNPDGEACRNISECNRLGIPYGLYWFSYAYNIDRAKNEATNVVACLESFDARPEYPVWFDWEYDSRNHAEKLGYTVSDQLLRDMAGAFCAVIEEAGYYAGIYANGDYVRNHYGEEIFRRFDLWYACLEKDCDRAVNLWQYAFDGRVDGIDGNVDMNLCMVDYPKIIGEMNTASVFEKSVETLAQEVLEGHYGNGEDRIKQLGKMYPFVQERVNEILAQRHSEAVTKIAWAVIRGDYGNGTDRVRLLWDEGYDPSEIQTRVNELLKRNCGGVNKWKTI